MKITYSLSGFNMGVFSGVAKNSCTFALPLHLVGVDGLGFHFICWAYGLMGLWKVALQINNSWTQVLHLLTFVFNSYLRSNLSNFLL